MYIAICIGLWIYDIFLTISQGFAGGHLLTVYSMLCPHRVQKIIRKRKLYIQFLTLLIDASFL